MLRVGVLDIVFKFGVVENHGEPVIAGDLDIETHAVDIGRILTDLSYEFFTFFGGYPVGAPVGNLACEVSGRGVTLSWSNGAADYTAIEIWESGSVLSSLPGDTETFTFAEVAPGDYTYEVRAFYGSMVSENSPTCGIHMDVWAVENLECVTDNLDVSLSWTLPTTYNSITVKRDGEEIATLAGTETSYADTLPDFGTYVYEITGTTGDGTSLPAACTVSVVSVKFVRGDSNADGMVNIADPVYSLGYLFRDGAPPPCFEAANANNDHALDISDIVYILGYIFRSQAPPPAPFPECGIDPTPDDSLGCEQYAPCAGR